MGKNIGIYKHAGKVVKNPIVLTGLTVGLRFQGILQKVLPIFDTHFFHIYLMQGFQKINKRANLLCTAFKKHCDILISFIFLKSSHPKVIKNLVSNIGCIPWQHKPTVNFFEN